MLNKIYFQLIFFLVKIKKLDVIQVLKNQKKISQYLKKRIQLMKKILLLTLGIFANNLKSKI